MINEKCSLECTQHNDATQQILQHFYYWFFRRNFPILDPKIDHPQGGSISYVQSAFLLPTLTPFGPEISVEFIKVYVQGLDDDGHQVMTITHMTF